MKRVYILVEGATDVSFLRRVLTEEVLKDAELVNAGGSLGIPSLARSLLVRRKRPIAVVMDSDSLEKEVIEERQQTTEDFIRAADASVPIKVIVVVPEIEAWLFAVPSRIEKLVGQTVSSDLLALGKRDPKGVLQQLARKSQKEWSTERAITSLDADDITRIRSIPEVAELSAFLEDVQKHERAA